MATRIRTQVCKFTRDAYCIDMRRLAQGLLSGEDPDGLMLKYREICLKGGAECPMRGFYSSNRRPR